MERKTPLMDLIKEHEENTAAEIRFNSDRIFFLNNQRQRLGLPRLFNLPENEKV